MRPSTILSRICLLCFLILKVSGPKAQQTYPEPILDQSYVPPSPNGQAWLSFANDPVSLFEGTPAISIPIYVVNCGSLSMPIALSYNYNGLFPTQDAGWVGLGWNLAAGGAITRTVEGSVDNSDSSGYNYGQYNLYDTLLYSTDLGNFYGSAYNNLLGNSGKAYDLAPDIFDAEFNGYSDKFFWINSKAYMMTYNKDFGVSWPSPSSNITITTGDGTIYTFGAGETTTDYYFGGADSSHQSYTSAWYLTQEVSADHKDTIVFNYATYSWQQAGISYQSSYTESTTSGSDIGSSPVTYRAGPSISTSILQSIQCRNNRISFVLDTAARTDISGNYPRLREIDVIDSLTGNIVKKDIFSYEYFGQTSISPALYERLALKTFSSLSTSNSADSLTYVFKYVNELSSFPSKSAASIDYWGYCNGTSLGSSLLPPNNNPYYLTPPSGSTNVGNANRTPNFTYSSYGALDTIVYPGGGYSAFGYGPNYFYNSSYGGNIAGPGICVLSTTTVSNNPTSPMPIQKSYTYLADNGTSSSGVISNLPYIFDLPFTLSTTSGVSYFRNYVASPSSTGLGGMNAKFYYSKVTESISSGGETHKSDHYFTCFPEIFLDVRQTEQIDYVNAVNTTTFTPSLKTVTTYSESSDTSFQTSTAYIDSEYVNTSHHPQSWYAYTGQPTSWSWSYWIHPTSQQTTRYDINGDSIVNTTTYGFNATTRNLTYTTTTTSDGQTLKQKLKYPEDYSTSLTGNMVTARVIKPFIEQQTWMYPSSGDSLLIAGAVTQYDQTIFKPTTTYSIEITKPLPVLNNETISGGLYTTLLSDSRYVMKGQFQYDGNDNLSVSTKSANINVSCIWDYNHGQPIATVKNAGQADIAYTSFEADGRGNWSFTGTATANSSSPTGAYCYNLGQTGGNITKSGLTSGTYYIVSYWTQNSSPLTISGTVSGYPVKGKTINGWTYYEHKITGQTSMTISGTGYIDELRLYPATAQMATMTYQPSVGMSSQCDADNRVTYYLYDGFNRLKVVLDQDRNVIKTIQYHFEGETVE
jgi:hypothetical protein